MKRVTWKVLTGWQFAVFAILLITLLVSVPLYAADTAEGDDAAKEDSSWWSFSRFRGIGVGYTGMGVGIEAEDLNDWLEAHGREPFETMSIQEQTIYWSFTPNIHAGLSFYKGTTPWEESRFMTSGGYGTGGGRDIIRSNRIQIQGFGMQAEYKYRFGHDRWMVHGGGGFMALTMEITFEETDLSEGTLVYRYSGPAGGAFLRGGIMFYVTPFVGVDLELGGLGISGDEFELGGIEDKGFPDVEMGGGFLALGLKVRV